MKKFYVFLPHIALIQALMATIGSIYFSDVAQFLPCILCWYQRVFMYPMVIILTVGILRKDAKVALYILPFSIIGACVALYHYLLQQAIIPAVVAPCQAGISCLTKDPMWFGFITIPLLSFVAFVIISAVMYTSYTVVKKQ